MRRASIKNLVRCSDRLIIGNRIDLWLQTGQCQGQGHLHGCQDKGTLVGLVAYLAKNLALSKIAPRRRGCRGAEGRGDHDDSGWYRGGGFGYCGGADGGRVELLDQLCELDWLLELKYLCYCDPIETVSAVTGKVAKAGYGFMSFNCAS